MQTCWQESPDERPNFVQLREKLEEMLMVDNPYLDLAAVDESQAYYNVPSFGSVEDDSPEDDATLAFDAEDSTGTATSQIPGNQHITKESPVDVSGGCLGDQSGDQEVKKLDDVKMDIGELEHKLYRGKPGGLVL